MKNTLVALAFIALPSLAFAQAPAAPAAPTTATYDAGILRTWKGIHAKLLDMAKDLPEDKFSFKPHPDSRTMIEEFRHVTIGLEMTTAGLRGEKFDYTARVKADDTKPKTRASVVSEMEAAIAASYAAADGKPLTSLIGWLDHQGEHYGKLVSNYRMLGIVPPVSRR